MLGALPGSRFAAGRSRRAALLAGGVVTGCGLAGVVTQSAFAPLAISAALLGAGGIVASSAGGALLADASRGLARYRVFGQSLAAVTLGSIAATALAGTLAGPVARLLGVGQGDLPALRGLVASGGALAALSVFPVLALRSAAVIPRRLPAAEWSSVLARFVLIEACLGFGSGSFMPFLNLFVADRFAVPFAWIGAVLALLAAAGGVGAVLHGRHVVPALGARRGTAVTLLATMPLAIAAGLVPSLAFAAGLLAARAALAFGSSATFTAYALSSFAPAERAGANAALAIAYSGAAALGSLVSGLLRAGLGDVGWTVNLVTFAAAYGLAAVLQLRLLRGHVPAGDRFDVPST